MHGHTDTSPRARQNTQLHTNSPMHTYAPPPLCNSHTCTPIYTHTDGHRVYPHHPWVMNNICLSIPPSLPLAWLLASSWLNCHNVILSASLSPITKMCSDNRAFFFWTQAPSITSAWDQWVSGPHTEAWWNTVVSSSRAAGNIPMVQTLHDGSYFFSSWKCNWLPGIGHFGSRKTAGHLALFSTILTKPLNKVAAFFPFHLPPVNSGSCSSSTYSRNSVIFFVIHSRKRFLVSQM